MPHGVLLTGGNSSRMGSPKGAIDFGGKTFAQRAADALIAVADPVVAVGPDFGTGLGTVDDPTEGPLVAFICGADALPLVEPVFLVACDVPFVTADVLRFLASSLGDADAVVPVVGGRDQPSISLFSQHAIGIARDVVREGHRSMRAWIERLDVVRFEGDATFADVDTPEDLAVARSLLREGRARVVG